VCLGNLFKKSVYSCNKHLYNIMINLFVAHEDFFFGTYSVFILLKVKYSKLLTKNFVKDSKYCEDTVCIVFHAVTCGRVYTIGV
jgi:hypothetical protein